MKGYDGHLIVKALKSEFGKVSVITQNIEKYLSPSVGRLKFIDSFQFTSQSLDNLVNTPEDEEFKYLINECTTSHFDLVRRKGVSPYDYMDSIERFDEGDLPAQADFYNKLNGTWMYCYLPISLRRSVVLVWIIINWTPYTATQHLGCTTYVPRGFGINYRRKHL